MQGRILWMLTAGCLVSSGCATTDCDPAHGGFIRGIGCATSGSYEQRQQQKQADVTRVQQTQSGLKREYDTLNRQGEQTGAERQALEQELAQVQGQIDALNAELAQSNADTAQLRQNLKNVQHQLDLLKVDRISPKPQVDQRRAALDKRIKELEREVDLVRKR